jgi:hypothetical protein
MKECEECGLEIQDGDRVLRLNSGDWTESEGGHLEHGYPRDFCSSDCVDDYLN